MQNIVEFHIIGRLGRIDPAKNVTHISVATNYNRREGETWKSDPQWHRITLFGKLRDRLTNATIGDLVRITGRIGQSSYKVEGETRYSVDCRSGAYTSNAGDGSALGLCRPYAPPRRDAATLRAG